MSHGEPDLQHLAPGHHGDAVGHRQRLFLVVRDEDEGDAGLVLHALQLDLHLLAQLVVQRRERLVEQQHLGARRQGAGKRHALRLAAGNLVGAALGEFLHPHQLQHGGDAGFDLRLRPPQHLQAEGDVVPHRQMREQRVALEDGVDRPLERRQSGNVLAMQQDRAFGRVFEPGDHPEQRGLAAARGAEQGEELVLADGDRHIVERTQCTRSLTEFLDDALSLDRDALVPSVGRLRHYTPIIVYAAPWDGGHPTRLRRELQAA